MENAHKHNIIVDSCTDVSENADVPDNYRRVPFLINVDGIEFRDFKLEIKSLLKAMKNRKNKIVTSCPSPADFLSSFSQMTNNFVVTISSKLSGAYNSAMLAKELFLEDMQESGLVHVFDSKSASAGETLVALKIHELADKGKSFQNIVDEVTEYISKLKTFFVIDSLEHLAKNGRISKKDSIIGAILHITPIMGENGDGEIEMKAKAIGWRPAVRKLIDMIGSYDIDFKNTVLGITHVNALEKAMSIKNDIMARYSFKNILVFQASGLSAAYADENGIILAFATR
ncbi:MAG: DegV family protein [Clostridiales bacterium]|nr:DegV family protein [Clostridiales bacterium]